MPNPSSFLTKERLSQSRMIAKGNKIRNVEQLVNEYGGIKKNGVKKSSPVILIDGKSRNPLV